MTEKNADIIVKFMKYIRSADTENFMRGMFHCFCAPTIKGIKAATLINFRRNKGENIRSLWIEHADEWLRPSGLEWLLLGDESDDSALVLIFRRELLAKALGCDKACGILRSKGYPLHDVDACLKCLREKFCSGFPHEIGLFLDYPPDDVKCFMDGKCAEKSPCPGYWKVYGNHDEAKRIFSEYKKAECEAALLIMAGHGKNTK